MFRANILLKMNDSDVDAVSLTRSSGLHGECLSNIPTTHIRQTILGKTVKLPLGKKKENYSHLDKETLLKYNAKLFGKIQSTQSPRHYYDEIPNVF